MAERPSRTPRSSRGSASPSQPQRERVSPARWAAFNILERVENSSSHSDDLLHGPALASLSQTDRNLTTALVLGVLRWQIALDATLDALLDRPDQPLPLPVRLALRMGAFQLRHMDRIPPHAALSESVELVRAAGHPKAAGLVNAVLRKLLAQPLPGKPIVERTDAAATRLGHPEWLVRRWEASYGRAAALAVCEYDQQEPSKGSLFAPSSSVAGGEKESAADLLDDGSRLVAEIAAAAHANPQRIWDACAAPGGKTQILAQRYPDAELLATDISAPRLQAMERRFRERFPDREMRCMQTDASRLPATQGGFDLILCDVPCSGTGTLARNPEIRHRLQAADLARQAKRQQEILSAAVSRLNPGGRLVYSTCSLEAEENEAVFDAALSSSPDLGLIPAEDLLQQMIQAHLLSEEKLDPGAIVRQGKLRTLPGANFQGDGFFAAVIARDR